MANGEIVINIIGIEEARLVRNYQRRKLHHLECDLSQLRKEVERKKALTLEALNTLDEITRHFDNGAFTHVVTTFCEGG